MARTNWRCTYYNGFFHTIARRKGRVRKLSTPKAATSNTDSIWPQLHRKYRHSGVEPQDDLRFYARGAFASPLVTHPSGAWTSWLNPVTPALFTASMLAHSFFDYPVRNLSGGKYLGTIAPVPSSPQSYDADLALALWDESARVAGVPLRPAVPSLPTAHAAGGRGAANGSSKKKE